MIGAESDIIPLCMAMKLLSFECLEDLHNKGYTDEPICKTVEPLEFASSVIIELHKEDGEYFVKTRLNGEYLPVLGKEKCPYEEFKQHLKPYLTFNYSEIAKGLPSFPT